MKNFEELLQKELDKLPYTKHLDDGHYNDGQIAGFELGARWALSLFAVSGSYSYEIDFGTHCRAGIDVTNNEPKVVGAIDGWGKNISLSDIDIKKL